MEGTRAVLQHLCPHAWHGRNIDKSRRCRPLDRDIARPYGAACVQQGHTPFRNSVTFGEQSINLAAGVHVLSFLTGALWKRRSSQLLVSFT